MTTKTQRRPRADRRRTASPFARRPADELFAGPIRGELLGAEGLATRARQTAAAQVVRPLDESGRRTPLLARLAETREILDAAHERLADAANDGVDVGPAGEWLLDNFYVVEEHVREVRDSLPRGYYGELRELATGPLAGYPRVYEIAVTLIGHTEARIDSGNVDLFVSAFQEVQTLDLGELWAIPAMLRLGLIESLRRMALRTVQRLDQVEEADRWAARLQRASASGDPDEMRGALESLVRTGPPLTPIFVSRFLQQMRVADAAFTPLAWLEQWMGEDGVSAEDAAARTGERMALTQVTTANSITSLRAVGRLDWKAFVERQSVVEQVLRSDPDDVYASMTFATRDRYRHIVEHIARRTHRSERDVARTAVTLAADARALEPERSARGHVGYYLVDVGRAELETQTGYRPRVRERAYLALVRHPNVVFVGGIVGGTIAALLALFWLAGPTSHPTWAITIAVALVALVPANEIAVSVVNQLVTAFLPPHVLPKIDFHNGRDRRAGIPAELRTAIVVPTLFGSVEAVRDALEHIEVQFLANRSANLHFAILSDFTDAATETTPADAEILAAAVAGVEALNDRYAAGRADRFFLFHRTRRWNATQGVWMGWERKRGKLAQFNRYLRGGARDAFATVIGDTHALGDTRYVITLDSDTVLPAGAAATLVGAIAHPLNRAVYDATRGRVVRGYGILQPRVGVSLPSAYRSRFASIQSAHPGVDPYTTAVSDVYQDLYGEGSFTGKGIYDVDAFEAATRGRFPENTLLSHDLIEGNYARAGLATDIEVYDDYPTRYLTYTRRKHRWIRGDWQLLRWLTRTVPGPDGPEPNRLTVLSRWKLFDNLRRSVVEIAQLALLVAGWTILPGSALRWTILGVLAIAAPWIVAVLLAAVRPPRDKSWRAYYGTVAHDAAISLRQVALTVAFLPHQAWISADAIVRTLWRIGVSRRELLEWQTTSQSERTTSTTIRDTWRVMWPAVMLAALALGTVAAGVMAGAAPSGDSWAALAVAVVPLTLLWGASPAIAHALSAPAVRRERRLPPARRAQAMRYALLHWRYFERFVNADTHWLAPDNFQEDPDPVVAMRTSPTNIGLQLLATISAHDLGFISLGTMTERLELAFRSLEGMRRCRGHFYNWYDLHDLRVLEPAYVSTVDSGNLAGHLIALRHACLAAIDAPVLDARLWRALDTIVDHAQDRLRRTPNVAAPKDGDPASDPASERGTLDAARTALGRVQSMLNDRRRIGDAPSVPDVLDTMASALIAARDAVPASIGAGLASAHETVVAYRALVAGAETRRERGRGGESMVVHASLAELAEHSADAAALRDRLRAIADRAAAYVSEMDFGFLFDRERELFSIGYQEVGQTLDGSYYDLLASEARLASFVAIAKHEVPAEHWFRLGRTLTHAAGATALVSWSGSAFEYLMPALVMRSFPNTVLAATYEGSVKRQESYGAERGVPWGVSESAYNVRDRAATYQYRAFGVPDLALKRGLGRDLVIAPYATVLSVLVDAPRSFTNLRALERLGALGAYGFHDALDFTRPDPGRAFSLVRNYMAHHVGMSLVALTNVLTADVWPRRFHTDPLVRSAEVLLHERVPRRVEFSTPQHSAADEALPDPELEQPAVREIDTPDTPQPRIALLGHLPFTLMVTNAGGGASRYEGLAIGRWRADATRDATGHFCYVKDVTTGRVWSAAHQPTTVDADWYRAVFATDRITFHRGDGDIETRTEITVVPADGAEVRRVTVTNHGSETREIELTSYLEIVLAPPDADRAHPAFANLFVETEWHGWCHAITATRRPRSAKERSLWGVHVVAAGPELVGEITCETDRARFVGRGRSPRNPVSLDAGHDGALSGTTGSVLDPIMSLRARIRLGPGQAASVAFTTLVADTRARAFELADRYDDPKAAQRALDLAWTQAQIELRELNVSPADAAVFQDLAGRLLFSDPILRPPAEDIAANRGSQPLLWSAGVSGDWPILYATIDSLEGLPTLRQLLSAHRYWRRRGLMADLMIINTRPTTYLQEVHDRVTATVYASSESGVVDQPGGVFVRRLEQLAPDVLHMLRATARVHVTCDGRPLARVLQRADALASEVELPNGEPFESGPRAAGRITPPASPRVHRVRALRQSDSTAAPHVAASTVPDTVPNDRPLTLDNGIGGFTDDGAYEIRLRGGVLPPAPWANVVANPRAGFVVTERGAGFSWAENSYFYRLTPWHNDPVCDPSGDVLYIRDEEGGTLWSATPAPIDDGGAWTVRHAPGSSTFAREHAGIASHLTLGVDPVQPVKLSLLRLTNTDVRPRRLTVTSYVEWTLGPQREHTQHQVVTKFDADTRAIYAGNTFDPQFAGLVAFSTISERLVGHTGDRAEFIGRNGALDLPHAMVHRGALGGATGAALDPCAVLRVAVDLAPGETREIAVVLGATVGGEAAREMAAHFANADVARQAIETSVAQWEDRLGVISVRTPDPTFDSITNRWSLYQALACRMWARSALYQSSGAYGFRDQLQDTMAFVYAGPNIAREHILRAAARQFVEGDVQHWWHPQSGRGVRTKFSDDLAWLPFVVDHYVRVTGDESVLEEQVPFITMRQLGPDEHEVYDLPQPTEQRASVYDHCLRALRRACTTGEHGLPLMGIGDWNDGMSRVGVHGKGESVWLAWFLIATLRRFAVHVDRHGDATRAAEMRQQADAYAKAVEANGWDGAWYRRAYFDDGAPLGSSTSDECRIDAIAQSWSVISGAGDPERQRQAMASFEANLVREDARILLLLTPPFDKTPHDPGYIKGYLPGVRENGAQYTHAALWSVLATALRGDGERALELFRMINPLTHASTPEGVATYKVEPYVIAADVYTAEGQLGRGGWTWYTGSASWMYRVALETLLGFTKRGDRLTFAPCLPRDWDECAIDYRYGKSTYAIRLVKPGTLVQAGLRVVVDGVAAVDEWIPLVDDGQRHVVEVSPRDR